MAVENVNRVNELLREIPQQGLPAVKQLFWTELNYERENRPLSDREWSERARNVVSGPPLLLARHGDFAVIHASLAPDQRGVNSPLSLSAERLVINQLIENHPYALFLFSDVGGRHWHLVNARYERDAKRRRVFRRISVGPGERLRTAAERIALLDLATLQRDLFGLTPLAIQQRHDEAFNVEAVTDKFFKEYVRVFGTLKANLQRQSGDSRWAHDFALQFLNRIMFLYYVQRKGWLGGDGDFLANYWKAYYGAGRPKDTFVSEWLDVLFFEAFNNRFQAGRADHAHLPPAIREALQLAPYLNGGLFEHSQFDQAHSVMISDGQFGQIFSFLEGYNFTISEDTPLDQEVAVDPEMIGKVYESLVNVSDEDDERGEGGIFYTPRVEIDLMCRLSLVDWLANHLGQPLKNTLYELVFAFDPEEKAAADQEIAQGNLWPRLNELLRSVTVLDPACGSGSFLVGMLYVLDDLISRANQQLGVQNSPYERKKAIIGSSLYGVDVKEWAVHVAELRLWLQLVIDTELDQAELKFRPLLPNLSFKIRQGNSLVQEVGGVNLALRQGSRLISPQVKGQITRLKGEKLKFYHNAPDRLYRTSEALSNAELQLFRQLMDDRAAQIDERLRELDSRLRPQSNLFGETQNTQIPLEHAGLSQEKERLTEQREQVARARQALRTAPDVPFVWDIAFVEIFEGEPDGFDVVLGNPPYVRQEMIRDPLLVATQVTTQNKRDYKARLARAVYDAWPRTFGYDPTRDRAKWQLDAKSDLYIYFFLLGLSLLNNRGVFCFITSNSWLDVGYGRDLQEFLLTRGRIDLILDNETRRSFASADVNTVITLLGAARDARVNIPVQPNHIVRFVMLTVPFEQTLNPVIWEEIDEAEARAKSPEYRVMPLTQQNLEENGFGGLGKRFSGDKWGGKYLRAPHILWEILEEHTGKFVRLGDVAGVRRGFTTGANDFFFLDRERISQWEIESEYLVPALKSPRECKRIWLEPPQDFEFHLLICHKTLTELRRTNILEYIKWGESQGYHHRPTLRARARWWDLGKRQGATINCNYLIGELMRFFGSIAPFYVGDNFQEIHSTINPTKLVVACNSTLTQLNANVIGRVNFGDGLMKLQTYEVADIRIPDPRLFSDSLLSVVRQAGMLKLGDPDRSAVDTIVSEALGFTHGMRNAIYEATTELVQTRLSKAESLRINSAARHLSNLEW